MEVSGIKRCHGETCRYKSHGCCRLFGKSVNDELLPEHVDRLLHAMNCQEEIIVNQKEIVNDLFAIISQYVTLEAEEIKLVVAKINETAQIGAEVGW